MDAYLAITSRRDVKSYAEGAIPPDVQHRILDAGRLAGSATNRQPWRFVVVEDRELRERLAELVYEPTNIHGAALVVALVSTGGRKAGFDHGRAAQNMLLAAWNDGVGATPNGMPDTAAVGELLGLADDEQPAIVLTFGYPARPRDPLARTPEEWSERANRKRLDELVERR